MGAVKYKLVEFNTKEGSFKVRELVSNAICQPTIHKGVWGYYQFLPFSSTPEEIHSSKVALIMRAIEDVLTELSVGHSTLAVYRNLKNLLQEASNEESKIVQ